MDTDVVFQTAVDGETADRFWELYLEAFGPLRTRAAARHVLRRDEFDEEMADPRVTKILARDERGAAVGLTTLATDLAAVPWVSPEYFAARYPEQAKRGAVWYVGFTLAHPERRATRTFMRMIDALVAHLAENRVVVAYDVSRYNDDTLRFADNLRRRMERAADVTVETVDQQTYYAATFR
ncbi:hypothetical protein [Myceligenerans xiligouense]|uniref:Acetyltransferase (GNAT) family protein n=1 Tax=Myceligenerans xiligouense TaxID=253184 RepID=A0A3N4ZKW0_9MICO|nr:hypothetical protein [Myceligenerans xiligouense]RPF21585.1 hypothetical protein EDD34_2216 [Myceligenerans xiligouense]